MTYILNTQDTNFNSSLNTVLNQRRDDAVDVRSVVTEILQDVQQNGDDALLNYTKRFDWQDISLENIRFSVKEIDDICSNVSDVEKKALEHAAKRIRTFHEQYIPKNHSYIDETGTFLGQRWLPLDAVGLYVPGGRANYPSSVLMNAIPASVAGVGRLTMVVPTPKGEVNPLVIYAAQIAGVHEIYRVGGAQAVAALAYGTQTIEKVDKIVGPGNAYVAAAKREVFGIVGIDMIAGPSEIMVIADDKNNPDWIAADLLSQAEHDPVAQSILITDSADFAQKVLLSIEKTLKTLKRQAIAEQSFNKFGVIITVQNMQEAAKIANIFAPEHLELAVENPQELMKSIRHAGAIFLGRYTPEAIGDYIAGPNHVLPTSGTAKFSSGLSVLDFMKRTTFVQCSEESLNHIGNDAVILANSEGLDAHALSVAIRLK